jgi:hypothetical protein
MEIACVRYFCSTSRHRNRRDVPLPRGIVLTVLLIGLDYTAEQPRGFMLRNSISVPALALVPLGH